MLGVVWHVLAEETADRFADPVQVAKFLYAHIFDVGAKNLPNGERPLAYTRRQLDRLGLGRDLTHLPWSGKQYTLPPSSQAA